MRYLPDITQSHQITESWLAAPSSEKLRRGFADPELKDEHWTSVDLPHHWAEATEFADRTSVLYRHHLELPDTESEHLKDLNLRTWLCLDGIMTSSDVWLDGSYLGLTEGYCIPHVFDITQTLGKRDSHLIAIEANCAEIHSRGSKHALTGIFQDGQAFEPGANPGGIWRSARIERTGTVRIERLRVICLEADDDRAIVEVHVRLNASEAGNVVIRTFLDPARDTHGEGETVSHIQEVELAFGDNHLDWRFAVENPQLWWPKALGDQPLYDLRVEVVSQDVISHTRKRRTGLRQIEMSKWQMHVNGERLFLKGANLAPASLELGTISEQRLLEDLHVAQDAGLDFVRLHSHVTRPEFYREADRIGMLIWQDLPITGEMARSTRRQANLMAHEIVELLGHHPSIAIWCAHNEPTTSSLEEFMTGDIKQRQRARRRQVSKQELPSWNRSVLDRSLKRTLRKADPSRFVVAHSGMLPHPPKLDGTDTHLWLGWYHGSAMDLLRVAKRWPRAVRFVSEYGAQSAPTEARHFSDSSLWPEMDWAGFEEHFGMQAELLCSRVPPEQFASFEDWILATQQYQAALVRQMTEHLRLLKYRPCGGFATYVLRDSRPAISFGLIDSRGNNKLAMDALEHACAPVLPIALGFPTSMVVGEELRVDLHIVSDLRRALPRTELLVELELGETTKTWRFEGDLGPDANELIGSIRVEIDQVGQLLLRLSVNCPGGELGPPSHPSNGPGDGPTRHPAVSSSSAYTIAVRP